MAARAARGTSVLFSSHYAEEAARYAGRVLVLGSGRLIYDGSPAELIARHDPGGGELEQAMLAALEQGGP